MRDESRSKPSQLREALNANYGIVDDPGDDGTPIAAWPLARRRWRPRIRAASSQALGWLGAVGTATAAAVLAGLIVAFLLARR
jgi:hypothetical protein